MRRPAEEPGAPLEPSGNRRPREMVTPDRIRLRGLLRENPAICRVFLFWGRPRASPVHHDLRERALRDCPTRRNAVGQSAWLSQIPAPCLPMFACSERRLLNEQDDPAEPPSNQRDVRPSTSNHSRVPFTFTCMRPSDLHASLCGRAKNSAHTPALSAPAVHVLNERQQADPSSGTGAWSQRDQRLYSPP
jgi:hypothetical protein